MQSVYAMQQSHNDDLIKEEKFLKHSILKMQDLYALNFQLMLEVRKLAEKKIALSKKKILATEQDLNPNTKFVNNLVLKSFQDSVSLESFIQLNALNNWELDDEYVKIIHDELMKSDVYNNYIENETQSFKKDRAFVFEFFKEIIAPNQKLADYYEDHMISWVDDIPFVNTWILKSIQKLKPAHPFTMNAIYKDDDDENFVSELFRKVVLKGNTFEQDIIDKTPNWELDRIADIDMILIKMALTEFVNFPSIPVRVTINEYIEIAKDYSSSKSGFFINGVLDKISKDYLAEKKIVKIGRGLL